MAELLCRLVPSLEQVRLVSSGTEATMSAIRLARGYTGRHKIVKFEGCYHGHADALLVKAGSGALTFGQPSSAGVPRPTAAAHRWCSNTTTRRALEQRLRARRGRDRRGDRGAGRRQHEPGGAAPGFPGSAAQALHAARRLLIFDEVMTGFRVALGGAQALYGITPDLTTLGKVIGGGMPVGAFGGRRDIMQAIAPLGPVYQAGTLSGNPVAVAAGLATLKLIQAPGFYDRLAATTHALCEGLTRCAQDARYALLRREPSAACSASTSARRPPASYAEVMQCDTEAFNRFFHAMLAARHLPRALGLRGGIRLLGPRRGARSKRTVGAAEKAVRRA